MPPAITDNPAAFIGALRAFLIALLGLGVAFGLHLTPDQVTAILNFTGACVVLSLFLTVGTIKATVPKTPSPDAQPASIQVPPSGTVLVTTAAASAPRPVPNAEIIAGPTP